MSLRSYCKAKEEKNKRGLQVPIPNSIYDYNQHIMGGVDLSDQLIQNFEARQIAHMYWKTLLSMTCYKWLLLFCTESLPVEERKSTTTKHLLQN